MSATTSTANLFVTKLPREVTDTDLMQIFATYNPVSAKVMLDASSGKSKGFGFVLFPTAEAGQAALGALNGTIATVDRRSFHIVMQPSKHDGRISCAESNALYIRNIPMTATRDDIQSFLSLYGTLSYSVMRQDNYGSPVWVVYAEYDCVDCAKQSLKMFHGNSSYFPSALPILAKYADSNEIKEDRRRRRNDSPNGEDASSVPNVAAAPVLEPVASCPGTYRHNPYSSVFSAGTLTRKVTVQAERRACPRVGPWIPIAAC